MSDVNTSESTSKKPCTKRKRDNTPVADFEKANRVSKIRRTVGVNLEDKNGITALLIALKNSNYEIALHLLKAGADINIHIDKTPFLWWVIRAARKFKKDSTQRKNLMDIIGFTLRSEIDFDARNSYGATLLMKASHDGQVNLVQKLLNRGANPNLQSGSGVTALMFASLKGHLRTVQELLKAGADINMRDEIGRTALMVASNWKRINVAQELLKSGADPNIQDYNRMTALMKASREGHIEIVKLLIAIDSENISKE